MDISFLAHGALVHIPMALAILFPLMYMGLLVGESRSWISRPSWLALCLLAIVQLIASAIAYMSGSAAKVLSAGSPEHITQHENLAFMFLWIWGTITALMMLDQWYRTRPQKTKQQAQIAGLLRGASVLLIIMQSIMAIPLGKVGGELVKESSNYRSPRARIAKSPIP